MILIVHNRYRHMGKFKLGECMKRKVLQRIVNNVAITCEECQKGKIQSMYGVPVKNKSHNNVARMVQDMLLPMCIQKLQWMLSDNGPEFVERTLQQM